VTVPQQRATVWTADCSATVQLERCAGPHGGSVVPPSCWTDRCDCRTEAAIDLSNPAHQAELYECLLNGGTPFDIYRWINLPDLVRLWPRLRLPGPVRAEWCGALAAMGLMAQDE